MLHSLNLLSFQKYIFHFLLGSLLILGCHISKKESVINNKIIITGEAKIENSQQSLFLKDQFENNRTNVKDNKFRFDLEVEETSTLQFAISMFLKFPIFTKPGDSIHIEFNEIDLTNEMAPPIFSGSRIVENNYFYKLNQILKYKNSSYDYFYNCSETEFLNKIDSLNYLGKNIINKYKSQPNSDFECEKSMKDFLKYNLAYYVESYHLKLKYSFAKEVKGRNERFIGYQKDLLSDDSLLLANSAYSSFLERKFYNDITNQTSLEGKKMEKRRWQDYSIKEQFEFTDIAFEDKAIKEYLKFKTLYNRIHSTGVITKTDIERFEQTTPSPKYLKYIKNEFSQMPETLRERTTLPNYTFLDKNYEEINLYDLKGKILYIDLWATWCGPCLAERPHFEKLIKYFENEKDEIAFIGISLDKEFEREKWKDLITRMNFEGTQLIVKNAIEPEICNDLKVYTIPRFIIVGRNGELIQSQALGPRHFEIRRILAELIRKP